MTGLSLVLCVPVEDTLTALALRPEPMLPTGGNVGMICNALRDRALLRPARGACGG